MVESIVVKNVKSIITELTLVLASLLYKLWVIYNMKITDTPEFNNRVMKLLTEGFSTEDSNETMYDRMFKIISTEFSELTISQILDTLNLMVFTVTHQGLSQQIEMENLGERESLK
tara:strand:- start:36 stop:383 length:348 start_codon:yes stop_codon:yes gene_type:complete